MSAPDVAPDFTRETAAGAGRGRLVVGIDEVGRGPWAGPVVACAVSLDPGRLPDGLLARLRDSKALSHAVRAELAAALQAHAIVAFGRAEVAEIDTWNILQASHMAMARAVAALPRVPDHALVDGNRAPALPCPCETVVAGDAAVVSIAAASIAAKVARDSEMAALARAHPGYGWERNRGYGTAEHKRGLASLGATAQHRRSFRPVRAVLQAEAGANRALSR
jgi:ribonuclease HII